MNDFLHGIVIPLELIKGKIRTLNNNIIEYDNNSLTKFDNIQNFFICEPFLINKTYYSISLIWKNYFINNYPDTKLITLGFCNYSNFNYIDLLKIPNDFNKFMDAALTSSSYYDIPIDGANIQNELNDFFQGHGRKSVISCLNALQQSINPVQTTILADDNSDFDLLWIDFIKKFAEPELKELVARWNSYLPYFEYLPFYNVITNINVKLRELLGFLSLEKTTKRDFLKLDIHNTISKISTTLNDIDRLYIRPEIYNEK